LELDSWWNLLCTIEELKRNNLQAHEYNDVALHPEKISRVLYLFIHKEKACDD